MSPEATHAHIYVYMYEFICDRIGAVRSVVPFDLPPTVYSCCSKCDVRAVKLRYEYESTATSSIPSTVVNFSVATQLCFATGKPNDKIQGQTCKRGNRAVDW